MSHAAHGRHRATPPDGPPSGGPRAAGVIAIVVVGVLLIGTLAWWLSSRGPDGDTLADADAPSASPSVTDTVPSASTSIVESQRIVTVDGAIVTVEETSHVIEGARARAVPPTSAPPGLRLMGAGVVSADGRSSDFDSPVRLQRSGSLTVRARYRLTDCPDVLPAQWPSPSEFPGATRTYPRIEEPLHTAYAICPEATSRADPIEELSGRVITASVPTIKLSWTGSPPLTIATIGAASGIAVLVVEPGCDGRCVAQLSTNGEATIPIQPVDPCPPANDSDELILVLDNGDLIAVPIQGLASAVCG